ncbi:MAG: succinate--CoA ligase subunit alpha [Methyloligellaceae bacterium]
MSILVDSETKVLCQGMTGRLGTHHTWSAIAYGTQIVGGVRPGKGGSTHLDLPVFDTVAEARTATGAEASLILVPAERAAEAMIEAIEAQMPLIVCVTERVPVLDMVRVRQALDGSSSRLLGPNTQGVFAPRKCKIGVMSTVHELPGRIGIVSRSATLTSEVVAQTTNLNLGQSTCVGIGGDPVHGVGFAQCIELFLSDPETDGIILIGELGGSEEESAAEFMKTNKPEKPVVALIVGRHAPQERRMGHAGTLSVFGRADADSKIETLRAAGAHIAPDAHLVGETMRQALAN